MPLTKRDVDLILVGYQKGLLGKPLTFADKDLSREELTTKYASSYVDVPGAYLDDISAGDLTECLTQ